MLLSEYRQVSEILVQPVVAAQSSVASATPAYFSDIGACWRGLSAGGNVLQDPMPKIFLTWTSSHFLPDKNLGFPVRVQADGK